MGVKVAFSDDFGTIDVQDEQKNIVSYDPADIVGFNGNNYLEEFQGQATKYIKWSTIYQYQKRVLAFQNSKLEAIHAEVYNRAMAQLMEGAKRPTKDALEATVLLNSDYQKQLEIVQTQDYKVGVLQSLVKALEQRKDMLIQYGAEMRKDRVNGN